MITIFKSELYSNFYIPPFWMKISKLAILSAGNDWHNYHSPLPQSLKPPPPPKYNSITWLVWPNRKFQKNIVVLRVLKRDRVSYTVLIQGLWFLNWAWEMSLFNGCTQHTQRFAITIWKGKNSSKCLNFNRKWIKTLKSILIIATFEGDDEKVQCTI